MRKTDWSKIVNAIGKEYTHVWLSKKTGISTSTLSRLSTGVNKYLYYDEGVKLMKVYDSVKAKSKQGK